MEFLTSHRDNMEIYNDRLRVIILNEVNDVFMIDDDDDTINSIFWQRLISAGRLQRRHKGIGKLRALLGSRRDPNL